MVESEIYHIFVRQTIKNNTIMEHISELFIKKFRDTETVTSFEKNKNWVFSHIDRIKFGFNGRNYDWLKIGCTLYYKTNYGVQKSTLKDVIIHLHSLDNYIGFETSFGNVWYFEVYETEEEAEKSEIYGHK